MTASNQDFTMYSGNSRTLVITIYGDEVDLIGATIRWILKKTDGDDPVLLTKSTTDATILITDSSHFNILLEPQDTQALKGDYYHECNSVDAVGNVSTLFVGTSEIKQSHIST